MKVLLLSLLIISTRDIAKEHRVAIANKDLIRPPVERIKAADPNSPHKEKWLTNPYKVQWATGNQEIKQVVTAQMLFDSLGKDSTYWLITKPN